MRKIKIYIIPILLFILTTACRRSKTESEEIIPAKSKSDLLVGTYILTAITANPGFLNPSTGEKITDLYSILSACQKDNIFSFTSDGQAMVDEGNGKCNPTDPQTKTGIWNFNSNQDSLSMNIPLNTAFANVSKLKIAELNETTLKLQSSIKNLDGSPIAIVLIFIKK